MLTILLTVVRITGGWYDKHVKVSGYERLCIEFLRGFYEDKTV
jgi:hypothetical protein